MYLNYISLLVSLTLFMFLYFLKRKHIKFGIRVLVAMFLGIIVGIIFDKNALIIEPVGRIFVNLIKMIVIPLIMTSLISSITSINNPNQLKRIGIKTFSLLLITTGIAAVIGILVANLMNLGYGIIFVKSTSFKAREIPDFSKVILDMVPANPLTSMAEGKIIPVVVFTLFIAVAITIEGSKNSDIVKPFKDFINSFAKIMFRITKIVIGLAPYGVFSLMASLAAKNGIVTLIPLSKVIIALYISCILHIVVTYGSLLLIVGKVNPIKFFKKIYPAQLVAFTTQSSYGTLPVTLRVLTERVKISDKIASFVAPIGANVGMNGCGGIYPAIVAIFVARIFNIELTLSHYALLIITTVIGSIGIAGVPGTATIAATIILSNLGLPLEGLGMILGIDVVLDMMRTLTNVTGSSVVAFLVANSEKEFDRNAFNKATSDELEFKTI